MFPETPAVLWATKVLDPGQSQALIFTAPGEAERYPFLYAFPGHWRVMDGVLVVEERR